MPELYGYVLACMLLTADISKMYRQIRMADKHLDYQRILCRSNANEPIQEYQLLTVTYGQKASPHLAVRALQQCAEDHKHEQNCFYVDDFNTSSETEADAMNVFNEMNSLMTKGGFELCKWKQSMHPFNDEPKYHQSN